MATLDIPCYCTNNSTYVLEVSVYNVAASKCHHCCGVICCYDCAMLLLPYVAASVCKCVFVSVIIFGIVTGNCCHCRSANFTVTVCNVAYAALSFLKERM